MLRASSLTTNTDIDIRGINGDESAAGVGVTFGAELMRFAEGLATGVEADLVAARKQLIESAGTAVLVDAAGVAATFPRMVRIADSLGIPAADLGGGNLVNKFGRSWTLNALPVHKTPLISSTGDTE